MSFKISTSMLIFMFQHTKENPNRAERLKNHFSCGGVKMKLELNFSAALHCCMIEDWTELSQGLQKMMFKIEYHFQPYY